MSRAGLDLASIVEVGFPKWDKGITKNKEGASFVLFGAQNALCACADFYFSPGS